MKQSSLLIIFFITIGLNSFGQCVAPVNLGSSFASGQTTFTWDAVPGASLYELDFAETGTTWYPNAILETATTNSVSYPYTFIGQSYDWRVRAVCNGVASDWSAVAVIAPGCPEPFALSTTNLTQSSATVTWQNSPLAIPDYVAVYIGFRPAGINAPWTQLGVVNGTTYTFNNLLPGRTYEWCVNQFCPYGPSAPIVSSFTTAPAPCTAPSGLNSYNITQSVANLGWSADPYSSSFTLEYKLSTATNWTVAATNFITGGYQLTGLQPSTAYQWRVSAVCQPGNFSPYSAIASFTTAAPPPPPANSCGTTQLQSITNIGNRSATFTWTAAANATNYQIWHKLSTANNWVGVQTGNVLSFTRTNFQMNSTYQIKVRAVCANNNFGTYSNEMTLTTLNCASPGNNSAEFIDYFALGSINRTSGADAGGYINTGLQAISTTTTSNLACTISAGSTQAYSTKFFAVFIDWNKNGSYADNGERVLSGQLPTAANHNFTMNLPNNLAAGTYGVRVILSRTGSPAITGCMENFNGETEDYSLLVTASGSRIAASEASDYEAVKEVKAIAYPNPSTGIFYIKSDYIAGPGQILVADFTGKSLVEINSNELSGQKIDLRQRPSGMYLLSIKTAKGKFYHQKLVVK